MIADAISKEVLGEAGKSAKRLAENESRRPHYGSAKVEQSSHPA